MKIERLGVTDYLPTWERMQETAGNTEAIWLCEHFPVYTQGRHGLASHILEHNDIPIVQTDRGGQITYHGPGQLIIYPIINLKARKLGPKQFVCDIEQSIIDTLAHFGCTAKRREKAPGVYVDDAKIASIGLRIKRGWSTHGLSLNIDMDLSPFKAIRPCGLDQLKMVNLADLAPQTSMQEVSEVLLEKLVSRLAIESS